MSILAIVNGYRDAQKILIDARCDMQTVEVVWQKLHRIGRYLDRQAKAEFAEVLS